MAKIQSCSFNIVRDVNAEPSRTYILRVLRNGVCVEAPRFEFLDEALSDIDTYIKAFPLQEKFKVEINL